MNDCMERRIDAISDGNLEAIPILYKNFGEIQTGFTEIERRKLQEDPDMVPSLDIEEVVKPIAAAPSLVVALRNAETKLRLNASIAPAALSPFSQGGDAFPGFAEIVRKVARDTLTEMALGGTLGASSSKPQLLIKGPEAEPAEPAEPAERPAALLASVNAAIDALGEPSELKIGTVAAAADENDDDELREKAIERGIRQNADTDFVEDDVAAAAKAEAAAKDAEAAEDALREKAIEIGLQNVGSDFVDDDEGPAAAATTAATTTSAGPARPATAAGPARPATASSRQDNKKQAKIDYIAKYIREVIDYVSTIKPLCKLFKLNKNGTDYDEKTDVRLFRSKSMFSGITDTSVILERLPLGIEILQWFDQWHKNCKKSADFFKDRKSTCKEISGLIAELDQQVKSREVSNADFFTFFNEFQGPFDETIDVIECIMVEIRELRDTGVHVSRMKKGRGELPGTGTGAAVRPSPTRPRNAWDTPPESPPSESAPASPRASGPEPTSWVRPDSPRSNWAVPVSPVTLPADIMKDAHIARIRGAASPTSFSRSTPRASSPDTSSRRADDDDDLAAAARGRLKQRNPPAGAAVEGDNSDAARENRRVEALAAIEAEDIAAAEKEKARKAAALDARTKPRPVPVQAQAPVPLATGQKRKPPKPLVVPVAPAAAAAEKPAPLPNVVNAQFIAKRPDQTAIDAKRQEEWATLSPDDRREAEALAAIEDEEIADYKRRSLAKKGMKAYPGVAVAAPASPGASAGVRRPASASGAAADTKVVPSLQISSPLTMSNQSMSAPIISPRKPVGLDEPALQPPLRISSPLTSRGLMSSSRKPGGLSGGSKKRTSSVNHKKTVKKTVKTNAPRPKKGTKKIVKYPKKRKFTIKITQ